MLTASEDLDTDTLPCSATLCVYQAFNNSMSYAANDVVAFRLVLPNGRDRMRVDFRDPLDEPKPSGEAETNLWIMDFIVSMMFVQSAG